MSLRIQFHYKMRYLFVHARPTAQNAVFSFALRPTGSDVSTRFDAGGAQLTNNIEL